MRIKKIEWKEHIENDGSSWFSSPLPFQYHVNVQATVDHKFHWSLSNWRCDIVCGTAPTVEQAKDACQAAWEDMVMKALEED